MASSSPPTEEGAVLGAQLEGPSVRRAVGVRAHRLVELLVGRLPAEAAERAASAATDLEVLATILETSPYVAPAPDVRTAAAYARGRVAKEELLKAEGGVVGSEELGRQLGCTRQAIDKWRRAGKVLAVQEGGAWLYPLWQFRADGRLLDGMDEVCAALRESGHGPWEQLIFFLRSETVEDESPLEALRGRRIEAAIEAARLYGEHGAK